MLAVLTYLITNRDRVVPKEELLDEIWGDRFVSESALTSRIKTARNAVGDNGRTQGVIRTVHGVGYQFVAELTAGGEIGSDLGTRSDPGSDVAREPTLALPPPAGPLLGRDDLVGRVSEALAGNRLVTLVGPAGVGKTTLARHVGFAISASFVDGAWFVPLAPLRDGEALGAAVLEAVGQQRFPAGTAAETLAASLAPRNGLLVLDNCEHVLSSVADLVRPLMEGGGELTILATSRQRLGVPGEQLLEVPVLDAEAGEALFRERAADHGLDLTDDGDTVAELCRALDQLPLALELACAQCRVLGVRSMADLLDERLSLLASGVGGADHHRTLESAIATSFDELSPVLDETMCRFSQFAGSFDLGAAKAVASGDRSLGQIEVVQHLIELAERSLVEVDIVGDGRRYRLLESIRLYATERLDDPAPVRAAHVTHYAERAALFGERLASPRFEQAWDDMLADWSNYRAAISYATELGMVDEALRLLTATIEVAEVSQRYEHGDWAESVLALAGARDEPVVRQAWAGLARMLSYQGRADETAELVSRCGPIEESFSTALAHFWAAGMAGDAERLVACLKAVSTHAAGTGGIQELTSLAMANLAAGITGGDPTDARDRARQIAARSGPIGRTYALMTDAYAALRQGDTDAVLEACAEWAQLAQTKGLAVLASQAYAVRVSAVRDHPDIELVGRCVAEALDHYRSRGHWSAAGNDAIVACRVLLAVGADEAAGRVLAGWRPIKYRSPSPTYAAEVEAAVRAALGEGFQAAVDLGAESTPGQLYGFASDQLHLSLGPR